MHSSRGYMHSSRAHIYTGIAYMHSPSASPTTPNTNDKNSETSSGSLSGVVRRGDSTRSSDTGEVVVDALFFFRDVDIVVGVDDVKGLEVVESDTDRRLSRLRGWSPRSRGKTRKENRVRRRRPLSTARPRRHARRVSIDSPRADDMSMVSCQPIDRRTGALCDPVGASESLCCQPKKI